MKHLLVPKNKLIANMVIYFGQEIKDYEFWSELFDWIDELSGDGKDFGKYYDSQWTYSDYYYFFSHLYGMLGKYLVNSGDLLSQLEREISSYIALEDIYA